MNIEQIPVEDTEESAQLDFKSEFNPKSTADWCELIKDVMAMANSGGGAIAIGVNDDGSPSGFDIDILDELDGAVIDDKLRKYVEYRPTVTLIRVERQSKAVTLVVCEPVPYLVPFIAPGEYEFGVERKKKSAFAKGTIYCRHGSKSEPCEYRDIQDATNRALERVRKSWLENVARITEAPIDRPARIVLDRSEPVNFEPGAFRLTSDPSAPQLLLPDISKTHPMTATQLANAINAKCKAEFMKPGSPRFLWNAREH